MLGKILLLWVFAIGGENHVPSDTLDLQEIAVYATPLDKYAIGQQVLTFDKKLFKEFAGRSLGDLLQQNSGLFLRQYGEGMVASLTIRGTSAGHTAVFWNGLPVNSPSLGQTDFSLLPNEAIGNIAVHLGSSGALYGTDAIGGAVHLYSDLRFNQGHQLQVNQGFGSYGRVNSAVSYGFSDQKFVTKTKVYWNNSDNDFKYRDLTRPGTPEARVSNAAVRQKGVVQDLAWNINPSSQLSTAVWYNTTNREIQPLMGSNSKDVQEDNHLRWVLDYKYFLGQNALNLKAGWVKDILLFNRNSRNETAKYFLSGEFEWNFHENLSSKLGGRYTYIIGDLSTYLADEERMEWYSSTTYRPLEKLAFSLNLRQAVFNHEFVPFTPSASGQYDLIKKEKHELSIRAAISKSYKIPTLNDRFWIPGGNPELVPEKGTSWETGLSYQKNFKGNGALNMEMTYYRMDVENWIIWLPQGSIWSPTNVRNVKNQGLEVFTEGNYSFGKVKLKAHVNYAYNQARNQTKINSNDRSFGKQLPYTPLHKMQWNLRAQRNGLEVFINQIYTGERFDTTDNESIVAPYTLWNAGLNYQWQFFKFEGKVGLNIFNFLNEHYQAMKLRAMPGRNYQINLNINL
ncbi:MAG: TonB-dependent receptor [Anditalea sp.]